MTESPVLNTQQLTCSPNAIATVTGKWLSAADSGLSAPSGASMELGGTQVKINGQAVPVLFSSATAGEFPVSGSEPGYASSHWSWRPARGAQSR